MITEHDLQRLEQQARGRADVEQLCREIRRMRRDIRAVRTDLLRDGYHRPNAMILLLDATLGEEHET